MFRFVFGQNLRGRLVNNTRIYNNIGVAYASTFKCLSKGLSIAEPSKNGKGEDAMFILPLNIGIGVFDGVGGWRREGIDPGIYSKQLSDGVAAYLTHAHMKNVNGKVNLAEALDFGGHSCELNKLTGSSTACFATVDTPSKTLRTCNLGDSGLVVFRRVDGVVKAIYETESTTHGFNFPRQIGNIADSKLGKYSSDTSADASYQEFQLEDGDVSVTATDGIWDNLFMDDIGALLEDTGLFNQREMDTSKHESLESDLQRTCHSIVEQATRKSVAKVKTPWSDSVHEYYPAEKLRGYLGGKPDDMTVIVTKYFHG